MAKAKAKPTVQPRKKPSAASVKEAKAKKVGTSVTRKWDVDAARLRYITDPMVTLEQIAKEQKVSHSIVHKVSTEQQWIALRLDYSKDVEKETRLALATNRNKAIVRHLKQSETVTEVAAKTLARLWDSVKDDKTGIPDINKMKATVEMLKMGQDMERLALSLPSSYSGQIGKDGELADPSKGDTNVVNLIQLLDTEIAKAQRNGVIDVTPGR